MSCIRLERISEFLCEQLKESLADEDPYVKKTAAMAVSKLFVTSPRLVKEHSFVKMVQGLLLDSNAFVVANACACLMEISKASNKNYLSVLRKQNYLNNILAAVNDTNEWGQIYILEAISTHEVKDHAEADQIIERILPRLAHNNPAVILSAVKIILKGLDMMNKDIKQKDGKISVKDGVIKKLAAPLITLLSTEPEIQYVSLRNINFIVQK
jgi:vesicle coat complex subunit